MKIRYVNEYDDINSFNGVVVSLWFQGCEWHCKNCFNPETWKVPNCNKPSIKEMETFIVNIIEKLDRYFKKNLSLLGGDPLANFNREYTLYIVKRIKQLRPSTEIYLWTGYLFEDINKLEILKYIDILVDGQFVEELKDLNLKYRGSSNQRVIDVQESLKQGKTILSKYN